MHSFPTTFPESVTHLSTGDEDDLRGAPAEVQGDVAGDGGRKSIEMVMPNYLLSLER